VSRKAKLRTVPIRPAILEWACTSSVHPYAGVRGQILAFHGTRQQIMFFLRFMSGRYTIVKGWPRRTLRVPENKQFYVRLETSSFADLRSNP